MAERKHVRLAAAIRDLIDTGQLKLGDRLPSTPQLAARYGVGHETIRVAMAMLAAEQRIVAVWGEGRWVWPGPARRLP
jgi:DNA-binding GntR family transcriptional regulator